ncbi:MAG: InlB B-repeat-containing protein, partial [Candidatus Scatosoma sp.]
KIGDLLISDGVMGKDDYMRVNSDTADIWFNDKPLVAEIRVAEYEITLNYNDGTGKSDKIIKKHGESIDSLPQLPDNESGKMDFGGWSMSMTEYVPYETSPDCNNVTRDISLYAYWKHWRNVTFVIKEGDERVERVYQNIPFRMPEYENPGYVLDGWFRSQLGDTLPETSITYESAYPTYYARWSLDTYTLKFVSNNGETFDDVTYQYTDSFYLPTLEKSGYVFKGWCENEDFSDEPISEIKVGSYGNKTLRAKFIGKVTLDAGKGIIENSTAEIVYDKISTLPTSRLAGYAFNGWFDSEGNRVTDSNGLMVQKWGYDDLSEPLVAKYSEKLHITIVYYVKNSGSVRTDEYYVEGQNVTLNAVAADGFSFDGYYDESDNSVCGTTRYSFVMGSSDITLKVKFNPSEYTLLFNLDGGYCKESSATVTYHENFILPIVYKEGKLFNGWSFEGELITDAEGKSLVPWDKLYGGMVKATYIDDNIGLIVIKTAEDFMKIKDKPDGYFFVLNDIDLYGYTWVPFDFSGTLYGDNITISNLNIEADSGALGMFKNMSGSLKNIRFENLKVFSTSTDTAVNVGGICASLNGTIENVKIISGYISANDVTVGGFAGVMNGGTITNCENNATVTGQGNANNRGTGGFVGLIRSGTLSGLRNYGSVSGNQFVGGIAGRTDGNVNLYGRVRRRLVRIALTCN